MARKYPDFPIVLEAVRECLQDVYDVPTLAGLMTRGMPGQLMRSHVNNGAMTVELLINKRV